MTGRRLGSAFLAVLSAALWGRTAFAQVHSAPVVVAPVPGGGAIGAAGAVTLVPAAGFAPLSPVTIPGAAPTSPALPSIIPVNALPFAPAVDPANLSLPVANQLAGAAAAAAAARANVPTALGNPAGGSATSRPVTIERNMRPTRFVPPPAGDPAQASRGPSGWTALRRLGVAAGDVVSGAPAAADAAREFDVVFDGRSGSGRSADPAPRPTAQPAETNSLSAWRLLKPGFLSPGPATTVPLPEAPQGDDEGRAAGPVAAIGLAVAGLGLLLFNKKSALDRDEARSAREALDATAHALAVATRYGPSIKAATGAKAVSARQASDGSWELVAYHDDPARLAEQRPMAPVEGLPVRGKVATLEAIRQIAESSVPPPAMPSKLARATRPMAKIFAEPAALVAAAVGAAVLVASGIISLPVAGSLAFACLLAAMLLQVART